MSWQKPSKVKCDKCGSAMVEKGNKIVCMNEECKNVLNIKDIKDLDKYLINDDFTYRHYAIGSPNNNDIFPYSKIIW